MSADPTRMYQLKTKKREGVKLQFNERKMQRSYNSRPVMTISFSEMYRRLLAGLQRLGIAVKYRFYQSTAGLFERFRLPWFKLGLAALTIFIVLKKDIHFSVNMQAPLGSIADDRSDDRARADEMSMVKTVSVKGREPSTGAVVLPGIEELDENKAESYIKRFSKVATMEMEKFGIPASIKMAQALLESQAGEHSETRRSNNHFGKPMSGAIFDSAWENWRAHSLLITEEYARPDWGSNYKNWARGLAQAGYNADKHYADKLLEAIDTYQLYRLDEQ